MPRFLIGLFAVVVAMSSTARADSIITFAGLIANGQQTIPSSYQPIFEGYPNDGGPAGITIDWGNAASTNSTVNNGVVDHSGDGVVMFDGDEPTLSVSFGAPVELPSFYFANFTSGNFNIDFKGYTNATDTTAVIDIPVSYSQNGPGLNGGYQWIEETGLAGQPITKLTISGDLNKQLDDISVAAVNGPTQIVREPDTLLLALAGMSALLLTRLRLIL